MKKIKACIWLLLFVPFHLAALASGMEDSYRWLEEESAEVRNWILHQQEKTARYFNSFSDSQNLKQALEKASTYDSYALPEIRDNGLFFLKFSKNADKAAIYFADSAGKEQILIEPPQEAGTAFTGLQASLDGEKIAYGLSYGGTDSEVWRIYDREERKTLPDKIEGVKFSPPVWCHDGKKLYYIRDGYQLLCHNLGSSQAEDVLLFQTKGMQEAMLQLLDLTEKEDYLVLSSFTPDDNDNAILLWNLKKNEILTCIPQGVGINKYVGEIEDQLLFITDAHAPYRKLIGLDPKKPGCWKNLIQEKGQVLESAGVSGKKIVTVFYESAVAKLRIYEPNGALWKEISLPGLGSVDISVNRKLARFFYSYTDFFRPSALFQVDSETGEQTVYCKPKQWSDSEKWVTKQVWVKARDGENFPIFLTHKKDLVITKETPVILYGYGGFALSVTPYYSSFSSVWMQEGGVYAVASIRGGFEFGKEWYEKGRLHRKKNVFNDFIDAAIWLQEHQIGSKKTLAIRGQSNGGLLTAACLTMRPDLFGAVLVDKGVLDMLRFHLFTIGYLWKSDYGDPDSPEDFAYLLSYSPYHNIKKQSIYPATLITTADHDDRVVALHSFKFAAALQEAQIGSKPILLKIEKEEGHLRGSCRSSALRSHLEMLLFLKRELGS